MSIHVLLIGNGAREHALAEALTRSKRAQLFSYLKARNPGIIEMSEEVEIGSYSDHKAIVDFAVRMKVNFAVIGPDDPIAEGLADSLEEAGIPSVAPKKAGAQIESSKSFGRDLVKKYSIPGNPDFRVFTTEEGIKDYIRKLDGNYVVKADGLMGGKGVRVSGEHIVDEAEGLRYALECIEKFGRVVIEEKLVGQEFSLMSFVDGEHVVDMIPVQDHKRAFDGDLGPNTGGMGSYSDADHSLPFLTKKDLDDAHDITVKVARALKAETGVPFKGILFGGFMAVKSGVKLIEYNARFGDPEAMNVLSILETDFVDICLAIIDGTLDKLSITFAKMATVCKYVVPEGYPENPRAGKKIEIGDTNGALVYYSSVDKKEDGLYLGSSRAIGMVGVAPTLKEAEAIARSACEKVQGPVFYRKDVGTEELIQKRVEMMQSLRS